MTFDSGLGFQEEEEEGEGGGRAKSRGPHPVKTCGIVGGGASCLERQKCRMLRVQGFGSGSGFRFRVSVQGFGSGFGSGFPGFGSGFPAGSWAGGRRAWNGRSAGCAQPSPGSTPSGASPVFGVEGSGFLLLNGCLYMSTVSPGLSTAGVSGVKNPCRMAGITFNSNVHSKDISDRA